MNANAREKTRYQLVMRTEFEHGLRTPAHDSLGISDGPRHGRGHAPVTVARQMASDSAERLPDSQGWGAHVRRRSDRDPVVPRNEAGCGYTADEAAEPDEARTRPYDRNRVGHVEPPVVEHVVQAGADDPSERAP